MKSGKGIAILAMLLTSFVAAQVFPDEGAFHVLLGARSLKCSFPWYASATWEQGTPRIKSAYDQEFSFQIDGINYPKSSARMIGNVGAEDVTVMRGTDSISFIEQAPLGAVNLTTVYAWRDEVGRFRAVHSRHIAISGPSPSQSYGYCQIW